MADKSNVKMKIPVNEKKESLAKMPQLVAPVNTLDEETAKRLFENQKIVVEHLIEFSKLALSIKKDMRKQIIEEVQKEIGDKIHMIDSALKDVMVQRKVFEDKGYITKEEINKKYEELKDR